MTVRLRDQNVAEQAGEALSKFKKAGGSRLSAVAKFELVGLLASSFSAERES